ncbi:MAG TPA: zinc-binding dehydrogenase [Isosphaeraceae bacterium]|jgi:NADPH:quinone reductase-like Zn-dependent oxidoreductase|nr:zinc-binding dehydrogenase [Isosphaeraceae bacterium]
MKAIILRDLGGPELLRMEEVADPAPGPDEAVVRLEAAALNHRDVWIRKGLYAGIKLPIILGSDGTGHVAAVGSAADPSLIGQAVVINPSLDWGPDDRVQGPSFRILGLPDNGTYAQLVKVPAANIHPRPAGLSAEKAAAIPLAGLTAFRAVVTRAQVRSGETVLVTGIGGGVSTFVLQLAKAKGARVLVTSGSDAKLARARELGADGGVNYHADDWAKQVVNLTGGEGPDVVIDSVGGATFVAATELVRPGGRIVTFGATTGPAEKVEVRRIFWKQISVLGTTMGTPREFHDMLALYSELGLEPVVDQVFPLAKAPAAHQRMEEAGQFGKIILRIE